MKLQLDNPVQKTFVIVKDDKYITETIEKTFTVKSSEEEQNPQLNKLSEDN